MYKPSYCTPIKPFKPVDDSKPILVNPCTIFNPRDQFPRIPK